MDIEDIKGLIASDESRTLELKKSTGELKDGMHSACAFLNTEGGWLIFGVTPKSLKLIGQEVTDSTQREIAQALSGFEPALDIRPIYIDVPDRPGNKIIAMHFEGWTWGKRPHTFHGCPYYKVESTTKVMPQQMYDERIRVHQLQPYSWENLPAQDVTIADLNEKFIQGCIRNGVDGGRIHESALSAPISDTLSKWNLLNNGVLTNGAVMLFSNKINMYPNFRLRMARFLGTEKDEWIDNQRAEGNFFDLLDAGLAFCFKHLNLSAKITNHSIYREERLEIPYKAIRETLINSLCHRQWEKRNLTNSIAIYDDRVEIGNPGVFPPEITSDNIKLPHDSYPYNQNIAETLFRSMILENWGTGVKRIIDACKEQGVEEPTWRCQGGFVYVVFKRPINGNKNEVNRGTDLHQTEGDLHQTEGDLHQTEGDLHQTEGQFAPNLTKLHQFSPELQHNLKNFLNVVGKYPSETVVFLAKEAKVSLRAAKNYLKYLQEAQTIKRIGSHRKGRWEIIDATDNDSQEASDTNNKSDDE